MYLGIHLGTYELKACLIDDRQRVTDEAAAPLRVARPSPERAEQDPEIWWRALTAAMTQLKRRRAEELGGVAGIALCGQRQAAVLLDQSDRPLRPAILGEDRRGADRDDALEGRAADLRAVTGTAPAYGVTAVKLLWVAENEPDIFSRIARVLPAKDYLRLRLTGTHATDVTDAAGTAWLDGAARRWSDALIEATGLSPAVLPEVYESPQPAGQITADAAAELGVPAGTPVAAGAVDSAAAAIGIGAMEPGAALLSLGAAGELLVVSDSFSPAPEHGVHAFCYALPGLWTRSAMVVNAAHGLTWLATVTGAANEAALLAEAGQADRDTGRLLFLPYLSGIRAPLADAAAGGVFFGLTHATIRADLTRAALEGMAFAFADGQDCLGAAGAHIDDMAMGGGSARSPFWGRILASALGRNLSFHKSCATGPAFGAARLARLAATGEDVRSVCVRSTVDFAAQPATMLAERYAAKRRRFRALRDTLEPMFGERD
jgi:xylulokinase